MMWISVPVASQEQFSIPVRNITAIQESAGEGVYLYYENKVHIVLIDYDDFMKQLREVKC
jgi:hypothetical protein